jgi:deoxyribonuclease-4
VGLGAILTRTDIAAAYRSLVFFGAHVSSSGGIHKTLDRAEALGADSVQLFTQSPRMWRPTNHDPAALDSFRERRIELAIAPGGVVAHALYLCNLAAPDDEIYRKSRAALRNTMEVASAIGADGVVFHVGSHLGAGMDAGLERVLPALEDALELSNETTWLLMENSAGAGGTIGRSLDELVALFDAAGRHERLGLCLDTCHLYASGYDVTDVDVVKGLLDDLEAGVGLDRLRALHVNDSAAPLGSNSDRHANIGEGLLGDGLGVFLSAPRLQGLPAFLEVPGVEKKGPNEEELRKVRELHQRWVATAG